MPGNTHIHSIDAYNLSFAGILIKNGGGDGGWVEVEMPQKFDSKSGVHGDVVTYKMGDEVATVRLTLLQQSTYNESLMEVYVADTNSNAGAGVGTLLLDDLNSGFEISGTARITQAPTFNIQAEAQEVVWTMQLIHPIVAYRPRGSSVTFGFGVDISADIGFSF
jgi:hypothetical protein